MNIQDKKIAHLKENGYFDSGSILINQIGQRVLIENNVVRYMSNLEFNQLMHPIVEMFTEADFRQLDKTHRAEHDSNQNTLKPSGEDTLNTCKV